MENLKSPSPDQDEFRNEDSKRMLLNLGLYNDDSELNKIIQDQLHDVEQDLQASP